LRKPEKQEKKASLGHPVQGGEGRLRDQGKPDARVTTFLLKRRETKKGIEGQFVSEGPSESDGMWRGKKPRSR